MIETKKLFNLNQLKTVRLLIIDLFSFPHLFYLSLGKKYSQVKSNHQICLFL